MDGIVYQLKSVRKDKMCIMSFFLPVVLAVFLTITGGISLSSLEEVNFAICQQDFLSEDTEWLNKYGVVHTYETEEDLTAAVNDPATNILGVQKAGNHIKVLVSGDELEIFKEIAASLPAIYEQRGDTSSLDIEVLPQPNFIATYKYIFIALILIIAMFMGCVFNAMNMISEKEEGVIFINEVLPMTKRQYIFQKIFIGFILGCLSSVLTVCFSLRLSIKYILPLLVLIVLSAFISALVGMLIGKWADGILVGITYIKITMIIFIAVPLISYLLRLGETNLGKLCYLVPSTATFEGIMGMINENTPEVGKSISIMVLHSVIWLGLFLAAEKRKKGH
ncbi:MAG: ABC transporter permease [Lachnospiraceae bacterium]|nr:ABC transporter permease [Lachnospiraceae bacterium]